MPYLYPVDAFECIGTDWGRSDHDYNTIVCHACFDALYPWTEHWESDHKRVRGMTIRPGGTLKYAMLNTYNYEDEQITECDCCHRIIFDAYCTKDGDEPEYCECEDCNPEAYAADEAKVESGEYDAYRARITARYIDDRHTPEAQRERARQTRARYQEWGSSIPEWCKGRQPKVDVVQA